MVRGERIPFQLGAPYALRRPDLITVTAVEDAEGKAAAIPDEEMWVGDWAGVPFKDLPWRIEVKVGYVDGVPQIVGLLIDAARGISDETGERRRLEFETEPGELSPTITADLLRQIPLRQLRESALAYDEPGATPLQPFQLERPQAGWGDDHYQAVAEVYRRAPRAPLVAIQERWGVSRAAASKWVAKARELGYLGYPSRPGVAGATAEKSPIKPKSKSKKSQRRSK